MDETCIKVRGKWSDLYRAIDRDGQTLDFMLTEKRDEEAPTAFLIVSQPSPKSGGDRQQHLGRAMRYVKGSAPSIYTINRDTATPDRNSAPALCTFAPVGDLELHLSDVMTSGRVVFVRHRRTGSMALMPPIYINMSIPAPAPKQRHRSAPIAAPICV
jgi:hypothetical protein